LEDPAGGDWELHTRGGVDRRSQQNGARRLSSTDLSGTSHDVCVFGGSYPLESAERRMPSDEMVRALVPALVAGIPVLVLSFHLLQQNRLERKKIEAEYLRRALEVLDLPFQVMMRVNSRCNVIAFQRRRAQLPDYEDQVLALGAEWETASDKHLSTLVVAISFANEAKRHDLAAALDAASDTAIDLRYIVVDALDRTRLDKPARDAPIIQQDEKFVKAAEARGQASRALVARIHEIYG
jgi:hypothetical protein